MPELTDPIRFTAEVTASKNMGGDYDDDRLDTKVFTGWWVVDFKDGLRLAMSDTEFRAMFTPVPDQSPPPGVTGP